MDKDAFWDWNNSHVREMDVKPVFQDSNEDLEVENNDDFSIRDTRPLAEIYGRKYLVVMEPSNF